MEKDFRGQYKQRTGLRGGNSLTAAASRKARHVERSNNRANAFARNREISPQPVEPEPAASTAVDKKKLTFKQKFDLWKKEKEEKKQQERELKKKTRPPFTVGVYVSKNISTQNSSTNTNTKSTNTRSTCTRSAMAKAKSTPTTISNKNYNSTKSVKSTTSNIKHQNKSLKSKETSNRSLRSVKNSERSVLVDIEPSIAEEMLISDSCNISLNEEDIGGPKDENTEVLNMTVPQDISISDSFDRINISKTVEAQTPTHNDGDVYYVSPFVTTSRGKNSARKEKVVRRSMLSYCEDDSPKHRAVEADYFRNVLRKEIARLQQMHDEWEQYRDENQRTESTACEDPENKVDNAVNLTFEIENQDVARVESGKDVDGRSSNHDNRVTLSEDSIDMINVALGQTILLIRKKFEQFRGLIELFARSECHPEGKKVTSTDLMAFWDMVFIQVLNINARYDRLTKLRANNWVDPDMSPAKINNKKSRNAKIKRKPVAENQKKPGGSKMRDFIKASRRKHLAARATASLSHSRSRNNSIASPGNMDDTNNVSISKTRKSIANMKNNLLSTTLLKSLEGSARKRLRNITNPEDTPKSKGILKTPGTSSKMWCNTSLSGEKNDKISTEHDSSVIMNSSKSVLFRGSDCNEIIDFDETLPADRHINRKQSVNLINWDTPPQIDFLSNSTPKVQGRRRSSRINRGILS